MSLQVCLVKPASIRYIRDADVAPKAQECQVGQAGQRRYVRDVVEAKIQVFQVVKPASADMSVISLSQNSKYVRLVKPASADMSVILLKLSHRSFRFVKLASADTSVISLSRKFKNVSLSGWSDTSVIAKKSVPGCQRPAAICP